MWLLALKRFWPYLAIGAALVFAGWRIYAAGEAAADARWQPKFAAAEIAKAAADARAEAKEELAARLSRESDERYAQTVFRLNERAADTQRSIDRLVRDIAAAGRREVPTDGSPARSTDAATEGDERLAGAAASLGGVATRCESDALQLAELQRWVAGQSAALSD
jgi:hypothetical protein